MQTNRGECALGGLPESFSIGKFNICEKIEWMDFGKIRILPIPAITKQM